MNAKPPCTACAGLGRVHVPIMLGDPTPHREPPPGHAKAPGFKWVNCSACAGTGFR